MKAKKFMVGHKLSYKTWLKFAQEDLYFAKIAIAPEHITIFVALFHAQQCAEKSLKTYLIFKEKRSPRTHDLTELLTLCIRLNDEFRNLSENVIEINPISSTSRYPDYMNFFPDLTVTQTLIIKAEKILIFVTEIIEYEILLSKNR